MLDKWWIALIAIWTYKLLINISGLLRTKYYEYEYTEFLKDENKRFAQYTNSVARLFKGAQVPEKAIPFAEPVGYGHLSVGQAGLFINMSVRREDVVPAMLDSFAIARGTYCARIVEAFSPLYWVNCVLFLPKRFLAYLGLKEDGIISKLLQLVYWITVPLLVAFRADVFDYIAELISKAQ